MWKIQPTFKLLWLPRVQIEQHEKKKLLKSHHENEPFSMENPQKQKRQKNKSQVNINIKQGKKISFVILNNISFDVRFNQAIIEKREKQSPSVNTIFMKFHKMKTHLKFEHIVYKSNNNLVHHFLTCLKISQTQQQQQNVHIFYAIEHRIDIIGFN